jgi:SHS2 domain-containing protein
MSKQQEKTEKIQVLLNTEDLADLAKKIAKEALSKSETPVSVSHYVRNLIRKDLGRTLGD